MTRRAVLHAALLAAAAALAPAPAGAEEAGKPGCSACEKKAAEAATATAGTAAQVRVVDRPLLDQDGRTVSFARDVLGAPVVVVDFVFTTCTTICPVLNGIFTGLQDRLGDRYGREVRLVTISIDPARDTPERLKATATKLKAREGWTWVTGEPADVEQVLRGLGAWSPDFRQHAAMVLVGDARAGSWRRFVGFPRPGTILETVDELLAARAVATASAAPAGGR